MNLRKSKRELRNIKSEVAAYKRAIKDLENDKTKIKEDLEVRKKPF